MDGSWFWSLLAAWIIKHFPSLSDYADYVVPAIGITFTAFGIFTNWLPEPGHKFPVPDVTELEKELESSSGLIIKMAKFTRRVVITINWFLGTVIYSWFYNSTNRISAILPKIRKPKKA